MESFKKKFIWSPLPSVSDDFGYVCKLRKALYGLKQAPCAWFEKFSFVISSLGFATSSYDYALFVKCTDVGCIILSLYVDDMIIIGDDVDDISILKAQLAKLFKIKDLGPLRYFMGIKVAYRLEVIYFLNQNMLQIFLSGLDLLIIRLLILLLRLMQSMPLLMVCLCVRSYIILYYCWELGISYYYSS